MDFQSLAILYASKTDEELLHLAAELDQLTMEAQSALRGEMARRGLSFEAVTRLVAPGSRVEVPIATSKPPINPPTALPIGAFFEHVFRIYRQHLWTFVAFTFLAVLIGSAAVIVTQQQVRQIAQDATSPWWATLNTTFLEIILTSASGWVLSWIASCFAFACICSTIRQAEHANRPSMAAAVQNLFRKFRHFLSISLILLCVFVFCEFLTGFVALAIVWRLYVRLLGYSFVALWTTSYLTASIGALVTSRFALALPAVVIDDFGIGQSLFRSDELTEKRWLILGILLTKSILGGYVAAKLPFWVSFRLLPVGTQLPPWFPWLLTGASIVAVSYVEPIIFIGFALLYEKTCGRTVPARFQAASSC